MKMEKDGDRRYTAAPAGTEAGKSAEESLRLTGEEEGEMRVGCAAPGRSCGVPAMGEHWYRVVVDNMSEAAVVVGNDGTIVYGNARFGEMLGLTPETIAGCSMTQFLSEKECERFRSIFLGARQGSGKGEFVLTTSDGRPVPVQISGKKVNTGEAEAVCLIISDISLRKRAEEALRNSHEELEKRVETRTGELTAINERLKREVRDRVQAEQSLRESEEHFRLLIENALDIIMVLQEDCAVVYAGPSLKRVLGYTTREFVGRNLLDFVDTDGRDRVAGRLAQAGRIPGSTLSLEARMRHKDGGWRMIEMISRNLLHDGKFAGIVVNGRDVTERKQMEEKLRRAHDELEARVEERTSELRSAYERLEVEIREHKEAEEERARLATAIEQGGDCVIITDSRGIIQYVNPAFERTSLYSREEMTGRAFDTLSEGAKDRAFWDEMWAALHAGNVWTGRITNRRKDGNTYEVQRSVSPIRDNAGNVTNYVAVERDMTEQAGLEAELQIGRASCRERVFRAV
jgi:PAS domain S-box-containing protein